MTPAPTAPAPAPRNRGGRPRRAAGETSGKIVALRLTAAERAELDAVAAELHTTPSEVLRTALAAWLETHRAG